MEVGNSPTATLVLSNLKACLPYLGSIIKDISLLATKWTQAGGFSETWSGVATYLLPGVTARQLRSNDSALIRTLADVPRSNHPTTPDEVSAAADRLDLCLSEWCRKPDIVSAPLLCHLHRIS